MFRPTIGSDQPTRLAARWLTTLPEKFWRLESSGGIALLVAALAAAICANSPWSELYSNLWKTPLLGAWKHFPTTLEFWINDGLMTAFFLVVGLELQQEIRSGVLADRRTAVLPVTAALGGMLVPALLYRSLNTGPVVRHGWGIPTATDIAFSVGILTLLGKRVPPAARIFLLTLATVDDIGSVALVAIFYHGGISQPWILAASCGVAAMVILRHRGIESLWPYWLVGFVAWEAARRAGMHPALIGLPCGLVLPMRNSATLRSLVAYGVTPLFAFANAGVSVRGMHLNNDGARSVMVGVLVARLMGKPLGILLSSAVLVRCRICQLPPEVTWSSVALIGCLAGIGFTVPVYIASIAFSDESLLAAVRFSLIAASVLAASIALAVGRIVLPTREVDRA